jgi:hypothetical protein
MNDRDEQMSAFDEAMSSARVLLPFWQELSAGQMRDLANGLRWLAEHFEQAATMPSLAPYKLERLRDLHATGNG